jgi:hypothetical protein
MAITAGATLERVAVARSALDREGAFATAPAAVSDLGLALGAGLARAIALAFGTVASAAGGWGDAGACVSVRADIPAAGGSIAERRVDSLSCASACTAAVLGAGNST